MKRLKKLEKKPLSIYVHFPYCDVKCPFCNLNAWERKRFDETLYVKSLGREIEIVCARAPEIFSGYFIETIFMGGGTPSLFSPQATGRVIEKISEKFEIASAPEISIEAHPLSCEIQKLKGFRACGINRISIGVQSFFSEKLRALGRMHGAQKCREALRNSARAGFENISVDIIAGAPGELPDRLEKDIETAAGTGARHVSVYGLEIEKGTRFYALAKKGALPLPSSDECAQMMESAEKILTERGLARYEISSFSMPQNRCRHNINYWRCGDYIGIGAGAHSHLTTAKCPFGMRRANAKNPAQYIEKIRRGILAEGEKIDALTGLSDSVMMRMRLAEGMDISAAEKKFGISADKKGIRKIISGGFANCSNGRLSLTEKGVRVANAVILEILPKAAAGKSRHAL